MQQKLAHYQIEALFGEGSFAWVYRAFDEKFERPVALKVLKPIWLSDPQAIARFKQEAKTMAKLRHAHIIDVYDVGEVEGQIYLAQLPIEGETLAERLARSPLSWDEVVKIITDIGSALDYAHNQGIIHRDIKPQNILLDKDNQAYLGDFGLVRAVQGSTHLSSTMSTVGTAHYMAPEIWDGKKAIPASDVYALTCVVFEMITGRVLFEGSSIAAVTKQHIVGPQFPERWPENVPNGIINVLRRGLAEDPAERIKNAGELATQLATLHIPTRPPPPPVPASTEPVTPILTAEGAARRSSPWLLIGGALVVVLLIAGIAFFVLSRDPTPTPTKALTEVAVVAPTEEAKLKVDTEVTIAAAIEATATEQAQLEALAALAATVTAGAIATEIPMPVPTNTFTPKPTATPILPTDTPEPTATPVPPTDTPEPTVTAGIGILLEDDFSSNIKGWSVGQLSNNTLDRVWEINNGQLKLSMVSKSNTWSAIPLPNFSAKDFLLNFDAKILEQSGDFSSGYPTVRVAFRISDNNFYRVFFDNDAYRVDVVNGNDERRLIDWSKNSGIKLNEGVVNSFSILVKDSKITLSANDREIANFNDGTIQGSGNVSLGATLFEADQYVTIIFDNLVVTEVP